MLDEKLYFPRCFRPSTKHNDSAGNLVRTPSNLPSYLNEASCYQQGYCVRSKDWKQSKQYPFINTIKEHFGLYGSVSQLVRQTF